MKLKWRRGSPQHGKFTVQQEFLYIKDLCSLTGMSRKTVMKRVEDGSLIAPLPRKAKNEKMRWLRADFEKSINRGHVQAACDHPIDPQTLDQARLLQLIRHVIRDELATALSQS